MTKLFQQIQFKIGVMIKNQNSPEKFLLDCFKYFDSAELGYVNYALFEKVV